MNVYVMCIAGKSTLTDSLVAAAGIIAMENVSVLLNHGSNPKTHILAAGVLGF